MMITPYAIANGLIKGAIKIVKSPHNDGVVCQIGEYWFYFGGHTAEEYNDPNRYLWDVDAGELVNNIYEVLDDFRRDEAFEDEYKYYHSVLSVWNCTSSEECELTFPNDIFARTYDYDKNTETERGAIL